MDGGSNKPACYLWDVTGNMLKAMRFTSAAKEMLETATTVPAD